VASHSGSVGVWQGVQDLASKIRTQLSSGLIRFARLCSFRISSRGMFALWLVFFSYTTNSIF